MTMRETPRNLDKEKQYKYFGVIMTNDGTHELEINDISKGRGKHREFNYIAFVDFIKAFDRPQ